MQHLNYISYPKGTDPVADQIDSLATLCEQWSAHRNKGMTSGHLKATILESASKLKSQARRAGNA